MTKSRLTFIFLFLFLLSCLFVTIQTRATNSPNSDWQWTDLSPCVADQCGTVHGTKNQSGVCIFCSGGPNTCEIGTTTTRVSNCEHATITVCPTDTPTVTPSPTSTPTFTSTPTPESSATVTPVPTSEPSTNENSNNNTSSSTNSAPPVCSDPNPGTPQSLKATYIGNGQVRLDWSATSGPHTSYAVAYGPSVGNYLYGAPDVGNGTSYTVSSLDPSGSYCFYVQAQNGCIPGSPSNVVCINHSTPKVLGAVDNYNPVVSSIKSSYGGQVLGATTQLVNTGDDSISTAKLPSGNTLDAGHELVIPAIGVNQPVYLPQSIGDMLTVGHHEVLSTKLNGVQFYYGHNATDVFGHLYQVKIGDKIVVTQNGRQFTYAVTATDFVSKDDVAAVKADTDQQIILMTCSYTQPDHRLLVKASLIN